MHLKLPSSLSYPITITELLKRPGDNVRRSDALFQYTYTTTVTEIDRDFNEHHVQKTFPTRFESSVDGTLRRWTVAKGAVIREPSFAVAEVEEPCAHEVQYGGMCAACGKDMTEVSYATVQPDDTRAPISMAHDNAALRVSRDEATRVAEEAERRLLTARKLSLVVDLDQTIIHATVDPTVGEWMDDPENPNHEAVKDVQKFQLMDDGASGRSRWYYIKLRSGLTEFLERVSQLYELHIYTMGTRAYAENIAALVDKDRRIFGDRILSRDESGSMVAKNLKRIFPVDTKMVVIIDDRADVWNWCANLVKVTAFSFFIGIGDINSSFLPKKPPIKPPTRKPTPAPDTSLEPNPEPSPDDNAESKENEAPKEPPAAPATNGQQPLSADTVVPAIPPGEPASAVDQLVSMSRSDDATLQEQAAQRDEALTAQIDERPLLRKQKELDAADDESPASSATDSSSSARHHLLSDDDHELVHLEAALRATHAAFFDAYAQRFDADTRAALDALSSSATRAADEAALSLAAVPDIQTILPALKARALAGVSLVFSGVVPLDADPARSELGLWARAFGARVQTRVSGRHTTHVVAARPRTAKVRQAARKSAGGRRIEVVGVAWLLDCIVRWRRLDEAPYRLATDDEGSLGRPLPGEEEAAALLSESEEEDEGGADGPGAEGTEGEATDTESERARPNGAAPPGLRVDTSQPPRRRSPAPGGEAAADGVDDLFDDDASPVGNVEDWDAMDNEMHEFLGSDDEGDDDDRDGSDDDDAEPDRDDESESGRSSEKLPWRRGRKRDAEDDDDGRGDVDRAPSKRRKLGRSPVPDPQRPRDSTPVRGTNAARTNGDAADEEEDDWKEFEDAFEAEMAGAAREQEERDGG